MLLLVLLQCLLLLLLRRLLVVVVALLRRRWSKCALKAMLAVTPPHLCICVCHVVVQLVEHLGDPPLTWHQTQTSTRP